MVSRTGMMLSLFKKRICPLVSLALAFGCGKKINDPSTTDNNRTTEGQVQELPPRLTLQINEVISSIKSYQIPRNAWFQLPAKLIAKEGNAIGKRVKIYYNIISSGQYDFHCFYKSVSSSAELAFEKCESSQGMDYVTSTQELEGVDFIMDKGSVIRMELTNPTSSGIKIESTYLVDWK